MPELKIGQKLQVTINKIGGLGDGIADHNGIAIFVPLSVANDELEIEITSVTKDFARAKIIKIVTSGKNRATPKCQYFSECGGCSLQHIEEESYKELKQAIPQNILKKLKSDNTKLNKLIEIGERSRRKIELKVSRETNQLNIGFFKRKSHEIVDINDCLISDERIIGLIPHIEKTINSLAKPDSIKALAITIINNGFDLIITAKDEISKSDISKFSSLADQNNIFRIGKKSLKRGSKVKAIYENDLASINFGDIKIYHPLDSFLQAAKKGEEAISKLVSNYCQNSQHIADLYSGCGTYSFALAANNFKVSAFEGNNEMVQAMSLGIKQNELQKIMQAKKKDLFAKPLNKDELQNFDCIIINPPRNGALPQIKEIAKSSVKKVIMVSCNPATFERDTKELINAEFKLKEITAIDQFYWSQHLEIVGLFER